METLFEKMLIHSHRPTLESYVASYPESFDEAIQLALTDKLPYSWRAAWLLWSCIQNNDIRIQNYTNDFIAILPKIKDNQKREVLKILEKMNITETLQGKLFQNCMTIWKNKDARPGLRYNAFKILIKIAQQHPDLINKIRALTQNQHTETLSPAVKKAVQRQLSKITNKIL